MALTKPILYSQAAFDATQAMTFTFNVLGGDQVVANSLVITNSATSTVVYNQKITTFKLEHTVPANSLVNNNYYTATITTYNANDEASISSAPIQFWCFATPVFNFTNLVSGDIINNFAYTFAVQYNQINGELLSSYTFNLYNVSNTQVGTSGIQYVESVAPPPITLYYNFAGFADNTSYYIIANGQTVNGTQITTGKIQFSVDYEEPNLFSILQLENDECNGWVKIASNAVIINSTSNPSPPIYIENKMVDLSQSGYYVNWATGFNISNDFSLGLWVVNPNEYQTIFIATNNQTNEKIQINWLSGYDYNSATLQAYAELVVEYGAFQPYRIYSNYIDLPIDTNEIFIYVRRINNFYTISILNKGDV